ncbi:MAG: ferrochelatase [Steroidobacteraceae bacterium]
MTVPTAPDRSFQHGSIATTAVLLVNLGTPDAPTPVAVRAFLKEFLSDPRVVEAPRWLWWLALNGAILRIRPRRSAHAYQQIWTERGSPLLVHSRELASKLQDRLQHLSHGFRLALGMTYGSPSIHSALAQLKAAGMRRLLVLPLYPQYSATTTGSVFDCVTRELQSWRWVPELRFVTQYFREPLYLQAAADNIREFWRTQGRKHLLFSFHSIPRRYFAAGDPYFCQCQETARQIAELLELPGSEWSVTFQSQVARQEWLKPYTDQWLVERARAGLKGVTVACPGFAIDNLETLEEIAIRNRQAFLGAGGEQYDYVPALNATESHVELLTQLILEHTQGWNELAHELDEAGRQLARQRAQGMGAQR